VSLEERERARLARELHDDLGQLLTSAALLAHAIEREATGPLAERAASLRAVVEEATAATRTIAWRLRRPQPGGVSLSADLQRLGAEIESRHGLRVDVHTDGPCDGLAPDLAANTYRIVQEALTNVVKHAGATSASVVVGRTDDRLTVVVEDDGAGFDPDGAPAGGMGLLGMRERASVLGGSLVVESSGGSGTTVRFEAGPS
jgi:signal transduction histidine kinase